MQTARGASLSDVEPSGAQDRTVNGSAARRPRRFVLLAAVAAAVLAADYATKEAALAAFAPGESMPVVGGLLKFTLVFNTGAAFSMGRGMPWLFFLIAVGVVGYIVFMARKLASGPWAVALGLIMGGALGNLVDRAFRPPAPLHGAVVDWIRVPNWPVFNIADSCIVVGGALAVLLAFRGLNIDGTRESDEPGGEDADGRQAVQDGEAGAEGAAEDG
ncbi:signal peptidase II, partial [Streptomonospora algeriensis]